nr:Glutathione S-transferase domain containing protein [Haemonchus contortus]
MVHYKLIYFNGRGAGEIIRQLFVIAGQDFEDKRVTFEEWPELKTKMPFHQLPVLEVDGKQLAQSFAIVRYLAKQFGYAGKNAWEEATVDMIGDQFKDFLVEVSPTIRAMLGFDKGDVDSLLKEKFFPARDKLMTFMAKILKENKSGYLVGDSLTWPDLYLAGVAEWATKIPTLYDGFPELKAHSEKIRSIPELKKWIETRPDTPF